MRHPTGPTLTLKGETLTSSQISTAADDAGDPFVHVNRVLYELCAAYPRQAVEAEVIGKILLIGRTYAAAVERRRDTKGVTNEQFYTDYVARALIGSSVDADLRALNGERGVTQGNLHLVLAAHQRLVRVLDRLTKLKKRSLASKYLHFHRPDLFFIVDSRAWFGLRRLTERVPAPRGCQRFDGEYTEFCARALWLRDQIQAAFKRTLTPRQLDRLLLETAARLQASRTERQ